MHRKTSSLGLYWPSIFSPKLVSTFSM